MDQDIYRLRKEAEKLSEALACAFAQAMDGNLKEAKNELRHAANVLHDIDYKLYELLDA